MLPRPIDKVTLTQMMGPAELIDLAKQRSQSSNTSVTAEEKKREDAAHAAISNILGEAVWATVMHLKKIPNVEEAKTLRQEYEKTIFAGIFGDHTGIVMEKLDTCLTELVALRNKIEQTAIGLQAMLPMQDLKEVEKLKTETGNAIHQKWQQDAKQSGMTTRFKPCLAPGEGEQELKQFLQAHPELTQPFGTYYRCEDGVWKEDILLLDNSQLQPKNSKENDAAANIAVDLLTRFLQPGKSKITSDEITQWLLQDAGPFTHVEWLKRNSSWASEVQKKEFAQLPALEAIRDFQVLTTIAILAQRKEQELAKQLGHQPKAFTRET